MPKIRPDKKTQERNQYRNDEIEKVVKKHIQKQLCLINNLKLTSPYHVARKSILEFVLNTNTFMALSLHEFPGAIEEIRNLPCMDDQTLLLLLLNRKEREAELLAIEAGKEMEVQKKKQNNDIRTALSDKTRDEQRSIKEKYVISAYTRMVNNPTERAILKNISENKMAKMIQERVMPELQDVKTPAGGKKVLIKKLDRKGNVVFTGLSVETIINILRNRDKKRLPFYPWEGKKSSNV